MLYTEILKNRKVFLKLYKKGRYCACGEVVVYFLPNRQKINRFGITVGKKLGNAVVRNRAKRIIRSAYRLNESIIPKGYDIVFVARNGIIGKKTDDIENFIRTKLCAALIKQDSMKG